MYYRVMLLADERDIIEKTQNGDAEAFGVLMEHFEPKIKRYGRNFLKDREDIQDIVQNVFMKAYVNIQSFDLDRPFSPWIYRIAHNEFANELRKKSKGLFINIDFNTDIFFPHPIAPETADKETSDAFLRKAMEESLSLLDEKYRKPIVYSLLIVLAFVMAGSLIEDNLKFHERFSDYAGRRGMSMFGPFYSNFLDQEQGEIHMGVIATSTNDGFILKTPNEGDLDVVVTSETKISRDLSLIENIAVVVFGERTENVVQAVGIKKVGDGNNKPHRMMFKRFNDRLEIKY